MVDIFRVWSDITAYLNKNMKQYDKGYKFIKSNTVHNLPPFPYCVVAPLATDIDADGYGIDAIKTFNKENSTTVKIERFEQPQMTFSLTFYSNNQEECLKFMAQTKSFMELCQNSISENYDIILLECTKPIDKTTILETNFVYKWGFDIRIRTINEDSYNVDSIGNVEIKEKEEE